MEYAALIAAAIKLMDYVVLQANLARARGDIDDTQFAQIKTKAEISDANWDARVAAAKARLASNE